MHKINYISEHSDLIINNKQEGEKLLKEAFSMAYVDGTNNTYRGCAPRFDDYYERSDPSKVMNRMNLNDLLYEAGEEDNLFYRTIDCDEPWLDSHLAFGLSSVVQACYAQNGYITATSVQKSDNGWKIHVIVDKVNRYNGIKMVQDTVPLKLAVDNWYLYHSQKGSCTT